MPGVTIRDDVTTLAGPLTARRSTLYKGHPYAHTRKIDASPGHVGKWHVHAALDSGELSLLSPDLSFELEKCDDRTQH